MCSTHPLCAEAVACGSHKTHPGCWDLRLCFLVFPLVSCYVLSSRARSCVLSQYAVCALSLSHSGQVWAFNFTLSWLMFLEMVVKSFPPAVFTSEYWGAEKASHPRSFFTPLASANAAPFKHHCQLWDWVNVLGVPCSALVFTVWPSEDLVLITKYMNMQCRCHVWTRRCYKLQVCLPEFAFAPSLLSLAFLRPQNLNQRYGHLFPLVLQSPVPTLQWILVLPLELFRAVCYSLLAFVTATKQWDVTVIRCKQ